MLTGTTLPSLSGIDRGLATLSRLVLAVGVKTHYSPSVPPGPWYKRARAPEVGWPIYSAQTSH